MRPRLLFLSQCLPYPPHSGVTNRTYHILKELSRAFDVTVLAFSRHNHQGSAEAVQNACSRLEGLGLRVAGTFGIRSERSLAEKLLVHIGSLVTGRAYTFFDYGDGRFGGVLHSVLRDHRPDLVHVDSLDLHRWLPLLGDLPVACTHHNIESDLLRQRAQHGATWYLKPYVRRQADIILAVEKEVCPKLGLNVMMSQVDADRLRQFAPAAVTHVTPNGVDIGFFRPMPDVPVRQGLVTFLGPSYMLPNYDGVNFFLKEIWGPIRRAMPEATFQIIGKVKPDHRMAFEACRGVTCTGYVEDIRPFLAEAACCVVPLRIGGGTRLKILDTWAMGRPIVTTTVGCEGLDARDAANCLIRDDASAFGEAVLRVLGSDDLQRTLGAEGRATAEATYSWDAIGSSLIGAYDNILRPGGPRTLPGE